MSSLARKLISAGFDEPTDDDFNLVSALYHFDGTNGGDNNTFSDTSGNSHSLTRNGNTTQGTFTPFSADDGKWSNHFELGDAIMTTSSGSSIAYNQSTFTCEAWILTTGAPVSSTNIPGLVLLDGAANFGAAALSLLFGPLADYKLGIAWYNSGWISCYTTSATVTPGVWTHVAVSVSSNTIKLFIDGTEITSMTGTTTLSDRSQGTQGYLSIGGTHYASSYSYQGFVSNCRVVDGTALYSGDFTPSTSPLTAISGTDVLACTSRNFDGVNAAGSSVSMDLRNTPKVLPLAPFAPSSSYSKTTNGGSASFDGTGDYLSITNESDLTPDTGDFTIECWVYFSSTTSNQGIFQLDTTPLSGNTYIGPVLFTGGGIYDGRWGTMTKYGGNQSLYADTAYNPKLNQWYHTAVVRTSNTVKVFVNGVQIISDFTDATDFSDRDSIVVGSMFSSSYDMTGYISGFRYVKGTAVYTSAFTPPTAPPTAVTNTELLLNFTNASAFDNSGKTIVETEGSAQLSTAQKKFGTASLLLNSGSSDALIGDPNSRYLVGTGHFTAECWFYQTAAATTGGNSHMVLTQWGGASGKKAFMFGVWNTNMALWISNDGSTNNINAQLSSSGIVNTSQWHHTALTWDGSTYRVFLDGTEVIAVSNSNGLSEVDQPLQIGRGTSGGSAYGRFDGYIDEVRITRKARYTSNFTVPTEEFANK